MKKFLVCAAGILLIAGCAPQTWHRDGASQQDFYMDQGACRAQAFSIPNAPTMQIAIVFNNCMQSKGWYLARD